MSAMDERTDIRSRTRAGLSRLAGPWWIFLLTGIAWLIIAWVVLRFTPASVAGGTSSTREIRPGPQEPTAHVGRTANSRPQAQRPSDAFVTYQSAWFQQAHRSQVH